MGAQALPRRPTGAEEEGHAQELPGSSEVMPRAGFLLAPQSRPEPAPRRASEPFLAMRERLLTVSCSSRTSSWTRESLWPSAA